MLKISHSVRRQLFNKKFFVFYKGCTKFAIHFFLMMKSKLLNSVQNLTAIIIVVIVVIIPLTIGGGITS